MSGIKKGGAAKWLAAMSSGTTRQAYIDGVQGTTVNPMALAAAADQLYLQRVTDSVNSGRRAAALNAVPASVWQQNAIGKGANRIADGAKTASPKMIAHFNKFDPVYLQAKQAAAAIPNDGTTATALRKVEAAINVMKAAAGKS